MSIFAGMARQAAALPPVQQPPARGRGLFGGGRPSVNPAEVLGFLIGGPGYVGNMRQGQRDDAELARTRGLEEAQRAQREQYAATIQDPRERQLFMTAPDQWAENIGQQFAPQVVSAGSAQVVNGRRTVEQPTYSESGDTILERSSGGINPVFTRTTPSISEQTAIRNAEIGQQNADTSRISAERPQITSLSPGQQAFGVSPYGEATPLAANSTPAPPNPAQLALRESFDTNQREVIPTLNQMRASLASGDVITGLGADIQLQAARALAATGNQDAQRRVAATEAYRNMSGRLRVGMAKTLGPNPSNADIALLEQVTAGNIGQNAESLLATIDQGLEFANRRNTDLQAQMGQGQSQGQSQAQASGPIAVNPTTGARVQWNGQAWVPL